MVYSKCVYCGLSSKNNANLSFHLFPKNNIRDKWLQSLGLVNISKWDKVCSNHFDQNCYSNATAIRKLLRDAIPTPNMNESTNMDVSMAEQQMCENVNSLDFELFGSPIASVSSGFKEKTDCTLTPQYQSKRKLFTSVSPNQKKTCSSSRFGDFEEEDFSTPCRAKRSFRAIKSTVEQLRQKNRCLVRKNKILMHKVETLNDALKQLNNKCFDVNNLKFVKCSVFKAKD